MAYIDDIICIAHNADDLNIKLQKMFNRLRGANLRLHPQKTSWATTRVRFLGHEFEDGKLMINSQKMSIIRDYPVPNTVRRLKAFLGMASFFKKFVKDFPKLRLLCVNSYEKG